MNAHKNAQTVGNQQDGGGGGIRTHGTLRLSSFQDWRNRPLYHPSGVLVREGYGGASGGIQEKLFTKLGKYGASYLRAWP